MEPGDKKCVIIDICVPKDVNVHREEKEKCIRYFLLSARLERLYPKYTYNIKPIVLGSTGFIPKSLQNHLLNCGIKEERIGSIIRKLHWNALQGSVKIAKTVMNLKSCGD